MLNTFPADSAARQPRAVVRVGGVPMDGWESWEVTSNTYNEADSFRVSFAISALPATMGADWFASQTQMFVEVLAGFPTDPANPNAVELTSLIYGRVDDIDLDMVASKLTLTGRDLTAVFIDAKITSTFENQHVADIVTQLAQSHGLTPVVTGGTDIAGTLYKRTQVRMQADRSEWELLTWLAREEGLVVYVTGNELHFEPDDRDSGEPYLLYWEPANSTFGAPQSNAVHVSFSRSLTVSKGITVTARSPSITKKVAVVESYPAAPKNIQAGKATPFGGVQTFSYTLPAGRTATQVQQYAEATYRQIVSHEMKLNAVLPGDGILSTKASLRVQGTGTAFDQDYFPHEIVRSMSLDDGYLMTVSAKNTSPANEVQS